MFSIFLNHSITGKEFFLWLTCIYDVIFLLIRSRIFLLTLLTSDLDGLIRLNEGLCGKLSLWSLTVICASWFCHWSTLSLINSLSAILFASSSTLLTFELVYFLYVLVILSLNYFLYSSLSISVNYEFYAGIVILLVHIFPLMSFPSCSLALRNSMVLISDF